jgi:hypothetical protein
VDVRSAGRAGVWPTVRCALRPGRWRDWWLGPAGGILVVALAAAFRTHTGHRMVLQLAVTHARDPWPLLLIRLPLSVFAPAQMLPFAFAVLQVTVVFGIAQMLLGWRCVLVVGLIGHALATISARGWIWLGPPVGLPARFLDFPDAGPSVAVVTLAAFVAVDRRLRWLAWLLVTYHAAEMAIFHGLSQREHLVGVLVGVVSASLRTPVRHWWTAHSLVVSAPLLVPAPAVPRPPPTGRIHPMHRPRTVRARTARR